MKNIVQDLRKPFALIQRQDAREILVLEGDSVQLGLLKDIPRKKGGRGGESCDTFSMIPFAQIKEKGYEAREAGEKIICLKVRKQKIVPLEAALKALPHAKIELAGEPRFNYSDAEYAKLVQRVIEDEIGEGAGANFVVPRKYRGKIRGFAPAKALAIFKNLLLRDYGSYWKFVFFDGERTFVGSTPERHLSVRGGKVKMNPISGTFRKDKAYAGPAQFRKDLEKFLADPKEINELFMVVDEELKMMARMCREGGLIIGPLLKEMSRLIHSEYLLVGDSRKDVIDLLRDSMFASTVTGSPLENACHVIHKYDPESRGYYGGAAVLIGRDEEGADFLDSAIAIRTAEIAADGRFSIGAGATLVRDSAPAEETRETVAKLSAVLNSIVKSSAPAPAPLLGDLLQDEGMAEILQQRNQDLSKFWFFYQEKQGAAERPLEGKKITIIDNEDDFVFMQQHMLAHMGARVDLVRHGDFNAKPQGADLFILGPGPGNPGSKTDPKMLANLRILDGLLGRGEKVLCICLGHQILCRALGFSLLRKEVPSQGIQKKIELFGQPEVVGFYNTFTGLADRKLAGVEVSTGEGRPPEIHALRGKNFAGFQFHPESILTKNGYALLERTLAALLAG